MKTDTQLMLYTILLNQVLTFKALKVLLPDTSKDVIELRNVLLEAQDTTFEIVKNLKGNREQ